MIQRRRIPWLFAGLTAVAVLAAGCSGGSSGASSSGSGGSGAKASGAADSGLTFTLIRHGLPSDSFWAPVQKGFTDAGKIYGVKTNFQATGNNPADEAKAIGAAIAQKVNGIAVTLPDAGAEGPAIKRAIAAGIPVITVNSGSDSYAKVGALTHVGQDEEIAGEAAGAQLKQLGVTHLLCVIHQQGNLGLESRCNGAIKTFGPNVKKQYVPGTNDAAGTTAAIKATLQSNTSIDGVLTLDPDIALDAQDAIKSTNSKAKLATFDLSKPLLNAIKAGTVQFAVNQQPYLQGYLPVVFLKLYHDNGLAAGGGKPVLTGPSLVDKTNVNKIISCVDAGNC